MPRAIVLVDLIVVLLFVFICTIIAIWGYKKATNGGKK